MGEVYLAQHPRLPRRDALKLLAHDWSADTEYRARFNREADLASTLWHPHIVGVHDRGEDEGQLWISMDFVDGLDPARLLTDRYPAGMPIEEVARIVTAVASALDYAHKQGLLHRDVKPANIMLTHLDDEGEQRILLTDFGIARNVNDISGLTKTNMTVGTVAYCSPEQLLGVDIDGRADQYSLAATAFHLLTGSQLFPHSNPAVVISRHLNSPPPLLADSHPELAALDPVLAVALARDPKRRFPRSGDFALALAEQADVRGIRPSASTAPAPTPRRSISPQDGRAEPASPTAATTNKISRPRLIAFIALPIIALLGVIAIVWRPWDHRLTSPSAVTSSQAPTPSQSINSPLPPPTPPPPLPTTSSTTTMTTTTTTLNRNSPSGSCFRNQLGMVSEPEIKTSYSLCTSAGWVHVDSPLVSSGACAHTGTVGPHADGTYTICTPAGWVDVNRSVCADFGDYFKDPDPLAYHC